MNDVLGSILRDYPIAFGLLGVAFILLAARDTFGLYARHEGLTVKLIRFWARKDGLLILIGVVCMVAAVANQTGTPGF